ncbi:unnamed protein product [Periconia digitata]|uniref:Uncharacterized protein n=1 Tax=Periconia digitata TaxID=1303443 RepID=A0A9W4USG0_9PLEO|nr:unnamed protein product [Periconia digitata]
MRRPRVLHAITAVSLIAICFLLLSFRRNSVSNEKTSNFHLLIVATGSDLNLCRLLLSASILQYPPPTLIDWKGEGEFNAAGSHLAKIHGTLRYLDALPKDQDNDMVLMLDGYDIVFQLGPEVLLQRYFAEIDTSNARLASKFKKRLGYNSILFGPDKTCFPVDFSRPACWAVPESPLSQFAFGPSTDSDMERSRPRWLNSGTIMGPAADMRALFQATKTRIEQTYDENNELRNSDQMYFSDLWAEQEYARLLHRDGKAIDPMPQERPGVERQHPDLKGEQPDYHVALDYGSNLFQTSAGYRQYLSWITFNQSTIGPESKATEPWKLDLPKDIEQSPKPFAAIGDEDTTWRDVPLGVNTVTGSVFPLIHFTGDKSFRDLWWPRMWFFPQAKKLLVGSSMFADEEPEIGSVHGIRFVKHGIPGSSDQDQEASSSGGARGDGGERLSWVGLCKNHQDGLFSGKSPPRG